MTLARWVQRSASQGRSVSHDDHGGLSGSPAHPLDRQGRAARLPSPKAGPDARHGLHGSRPRMPGRRADRPRSRAAEQAARASGGRSSFTCQSFLTDVGPTRWPLRWPLRRPDLFSLHFPADRGAAGLRPYPPDRPCAPLPGGSYGPRSRPEWQWPVLRGCGSVPCSRKTRKSSTIRLPRRTRSFWS